VVPLEQPQCQAMKYLQWMRAAWCCWHVLRSTDPKLPLPAFPPPRPTMPSSCRDSTVQLRAPPCMNCNNSPNRQDARPGDGDCSVADYFCEALLYEPTATSHLPAVPLSVC
jgi:hypothetical protein